MLTPVQLLINSEEQIYQVRGKGIFLFWFDTADDSLRFRFRVFNYELKKIGLPRSSVYKKSKKRKKTAHRFYGFKYIDRLVLDIVHSFRVKIFEVNIDTGDVVLNARLFPFIYILSNRKYQISINFDDINYVNIEMDNRLHRLAAAGIKFGYRRYIKDRWF